MEKPLGPRALSRWRIQITCLTSTSSTYFVRELFASSVISLECALRSLHNFVPLDLKKEISWNVDVIPFLFPLDPFYQLTLRWLLNQCAFWEISFWWCCGKRLCFCHWNESTSFLILISISPPHFYYSCKFPSEFIFLLADAPLLHHLPQWFPNIF